VGLTSVDDELFLLLVRDFNQVAVYSTNDYQLLRHLNVPGYEPHHTSDMTSCVRRKCLHMSDFRKRCIHRYALDSNATSKWPVSSYPFSLSVTPNGNLLVACHNPKQLVELSAESGKQVRAISLQKDIKYLWHGIQLANGQFVVCHGDSLQRVCMVDDDGRVTRSYGGKRGSGDGELSRLRDLRDLAVDEDSQLIFVSDCYDNRVVVLRLQFVRYIRDGIRWPRQLHLDQTTRRLYVGQVKGAIVMQL